MRAAGGLVVRRTLGGYTEIAVVHRPGREDWSFPKGKLEEHESLEQAALREVHEETGLSCRLLRFIGHTHYLDRKGRPKAVAYWVMAAVGGFFTPTGVGTELAAGKETRVIDGREYVLELPLAADFALIKAHRGDRLGNLSYRGTMRNFNMIMATAAKTVIAEVDELVEVGAMAPDDVHTPGIFVDHLIQVARHPELLKVATRGEDAP